MRLFHLTLGAVALHLAAPASACWDEVARKYHSYGIDAQILYKIAKAESSLNPRAINYNVNGTRDIGLMQINTSWVPRLHEQFHIRESDLYNWCTNLDVGAWILSDLFQKYGKNWEAIGAYNAACNGVSTQRCRAARATYAWRVHAQLAPRG